MSINGTEKSERSGSPVHWDPNGLDFAFEQVRVSYDKLKAPWTTEKY